MDWTILLKDLSIFTVGAFSLTRIVVYISKKIFETQISILKNEHLFRFTTLYPDKIKVIKKTFKKIVKTEKAFKELTILESKEDEKKRNYNNALECLNSFFDYYEENELLIDDSSLSHIEKLKLKFDDIVNAHNRAENMEIMVRGTKAWVDAIENNIEVAKTALDKQIPEIKRQLKKDFQDKYKLMEIENS